MYRSMKDVKQAHQLQGGSFFSEQKTSRWERRALPDLYGGRFFITAEFADQLGSLHNARQYRINEAKDDGSVATMKTNPGSFPSIRDARRYIVGKLLGNDRFVQDTLEGFGI